MKLGYALNTLGQRWSNPVGGVVKALCNSLVSRIIGLSNNPLTSQKRRGYHEYLSQVSNTE